MSLVLLSGCFRCRRQCCEMRHSVTCSLGVYILLLAVLFSVDAYIPAMPATRLIPTSTGPSDTTDTHSPNSAIQRLYLAQTPHRTYYVTVGIGTPQQYLRLLVHSGIADMWIHECTSYYSIDCQTRAAYNPAHSSTVKLERYLREYATQLYPQGFLYGKMEKEFVRLGNKFVSNQPFCGYGELYYGHSMPMFFTQLDGFLGLGPPADSLLPGNPFFVNLMARAAVPEPQISIYLYNGLGGELVLGGIDPKHNASVHKWVHIMNDRGSWSMQVEDIFMDKVFRSCDAWCRATINTGFPHIAGPPKEIQKINEYLTSIGNGGLSNREQPCEQRVYNIAQEFIRIKHENSNQKMCSTSGLCEEAQFAYMSTWNVQELLRRNVKDFQHDFGCAVCLSIADAIQANEDYDPEIGTSLCNWIDDLEQKTSEEHDTEEVDCSSIEIFKFLRLRINDVFLFVDSEQYTYKRIHKNLLITCHTEFVEFKQSSGTDWILGTSFLRAFHTVIDFEHNQVGFAKPEKL